jgi:hypothetical protein
MNLTSREGKISSILTEIKANNIGKNHRVISLVQTPHTPVPFLTDQLLEPRFQHLHASFGIVHQNVY